MPVLTEKYMERLRDMNEGYRYSAAHPLWKNTPTPELYDVMRIYSGVRGCLKYYARGVALAIRDIIRQRGRQAA